MAAYQLKVYRGTKDGQIIETITEKPALVGDQVLLSITHSGVCGTDEHVLPYGIALGHEGVAVVKELGPDVKSLKVGDRVGWGYSNGACRQCPTCLKGFEIRCESPEGFRYGEGFFDSGSFATQAIRQEAFVYGIPDALASAHAAPLMCGGITVWAGLNDGTVNVTETIGIVGLGGLGHLAIQFAKAMGHRVIVFSTTDSKKEEALKLGATEFVSTKGKTELKVGSRIDRLLVTASHRPDWSLFLPLMNTESKVYPMTVVEMNVKLDLPYMILLQKGIDVIFPAPRKVQYSEMLAFAALHGVAPIVERDELSVNGIIQSLEKLRTGKTRYRGVLYAAGEI